LRTREQLAATDGLVSNPVCLATKIFCQADTQVKMQNLNSISFSDVWYVVLHGDRGAEQWAVVRGEHRRESGPEPGTAGRL
jgi:hypothetical protein